MPDEGDVEIAWRALARKTAVMDAAGNRIGETRDLLADDRNDIFHGLAVKLSGTGKTVEIGADRIPKITRNRVYTTLAPGDLETLRVLRG